MRPRPWPFGQESRRCTTHHQANAAPLRLRDAPVPPCVTPKFGASPAIATRLCNIPMSHQSDSNSIYCCLRRFAAIQLQGSTTLLLAMRATYARLDATAGLCPCHAHRGLGFFHDSQSCARSQTTHSRLPCPPRTQTVRQDRLPRTCGSSRPTLHARRRHGRQRLGCRLNFYSVSHAAAARFTC